MTHDHAFLLSKELANNDISHSIVVGVHQNFIPNPSCRIEMHMRNLVEGTTWSALEDLRSLVVKTVPGAELHISMFGEGKVYAA